MYVILKLVNEKIRILKRRGCCECGNYESYG